MPRDDQGLTHGKTMGRRMLLPLWARLHAEVAARCAVDLDFRLRVLAADGWERPTLTSAARDWAAAQGRMQ